MDGEEDDQRRLADHFRRPTRLHFSKDHLDFGFRALDMSNARYPTAVRTSVSRKLGFLTRRKRYEDFADPAIEHAMCWPNERVEDGAQIGLCDESEIDFTFVNAKRELARRWFSELTLSIAQARKPLGVLVFGDPGTGKSTLLKYLIQTHRPHSDAAGVIYSRFETQKYLRVLAVARKSRPRLESVPFFVSYLHAMALRDIITNDAVERRTDGKDYVRPTAQWFGDGRAIDTLVEAALGNHPSVSGSDESEAAARIREACLNGPFNPNVLERIPPKPLMQVVQHVVGNRRIAFVFDGLDHLQPNDETIEQDKYLIFGLLMNQFNSAATELNTILHHAMPYLGAQIIVQRHRTYEDWLRLLQANGQAWGELGDPNFERVYVAPSPADVILLKSIPRPDSREGINLPVERTFFVLQKVVESASRAIQASKGPLAERTSLFGIFDGHLRDEFEYLHRIMLWASEDLADARNQNIDARDFILRLERTDIEREFAKKRYRLVELLLRFDWPAFENLLHVAGTPILSETSGMRIGPTLSRNDRHTGLVDNIFNYSVADAHAGDCENHCLLIKVRILQFLARETGPSSNRPPKSGAEIKAFLRTLSYSEPALMRSEELVQVLRYGGLMREHPDYTGSVRQNFDERRYSITQRGHFATTSLIFNTGYLEHCFHGTLLPSHILPTGRAEPRDTKVFQWSVNSIVNYYLLSNYITYIESNSRSALDNFAISERIMVAMLNSVIHMCQEDRPRNRASIAHEALREIDRLRSEWRHAGVITV